MTTHFRRMGIVIIPIRINNSQYGIEMKLIRFNFDNDRTRSGPNYFILWRPNRDSCSKAAHANNNNNDNNINMAKIQPIELNC